MKQKKIIISALAVLILCGGWYGYREFNRKVKDLGSVRSDMKLTTDALISSFEKDELKSNTLYLDKIIAVTGMIRAIEKDEKGQFTIVLGNDDSMSSVRCSMDPDHNDEFTSLTEGKIVSLKGACTGFNSDELLGSDVILNRCVVD